MILRHLSAAAFYGNASSQTRLLCKENDLKNVWGGREFVNWYNGHPEMKDRAPPMLDCEHAVVVGQGNVALDIARILAKDIDELAKTDISRDALEVLSQSKLERISLVGRRGSAQAAFTIKEMRELTRLGDNVGCIIRPEEYALGMTEASKEEIKARAKKRINDVLVKVVDSYEQERSRARVVDMRFLLSPSELFHDSENRISGVACRRNMLIGGPGEQRAVPVEDAPVENFSCGLLVRSIGYQSVPLPGVPFDSNTNTVTHTAGRVAGVAGLYASGWLKRGPTGIIGTNINDARETVDCMVEDFEKLDASDSASRERKDIFQLVGSDHPFVDWNGYQRIDKEEIQRGEASTPAAPREKLLSIADMLQAAKATS